MPDLIRHPASSTSPPAKGSGTPDQVRGDGGGDWRRIPGARFPCLGNRGIETGAVPPPSRLRGRCMGDLGPGKPGMPACNRPMRRHPVEGWPRNLDRVACYCPWRFDPPASPGATPHDAVRKLRSWPGVTPKDWKTSPHVVRVAPLHDVGIAMAETMPRSFTLWAKIHSHACRGASRRSCPLA